LTGNRHHFPLFQAFLASLRRRSGQNREKTAERMTGNRKKYPYNQ